MSSIRSPRCAAVCAAFLVVAPFVQVGRAATRPLPEDVNVKAFASREDGRLELLVRVPLAAVKDIEFPTRGDEGYLNLTSVKSMLPGAARYWISNCFEVYENGAAEPRPEVQQTRISLSSDQSFESYHDALSHFNSGDLPPETNVLWDQVWLDIHYEYSLRSETSVLSIRPKFAALGVRVLTDMKYVALGGAVRDFSFEGDPGLIHLDARWTDAAKQFLQWGFGFVVRSTDFLLFLFCLALPLRRYREIGPAVTAFVLALSLALLASAAGFAPDPIWFHPMIETLSAIAILLTAFANIASRVTPQRRALLALGFGFIYGFSCAFDFADKVQFGGSHAVFSAIAYNAGVVLAVTCAIAVLVPVLSFLFSFARTERVELIIVSALAADTAWSWLDERWSRLSRVPFHALVFNAGLLTVTLRCLAVLVLFGGLLWFASGWLESRNFSHGETSSQAKGRTI